MTVNLISESFYVKCVQEDPASELKEIDKDKNSTQAQIIANNIQPFNNPMLVI